MPLTGESIQSQPEWLDNAFVAVSQSFSEVEPEIQQISDLSIEFANHAPGDKPATELFEGPSVKITGAEIKKLVVLRTGNQDNPEVSLQLNLYLPFTRPIWKWLGEMGGQEIHMAFQSGKPAVEVASAQTTFVDERPELDPTHDAEFPMEGIPTADYEESVRKSLGVNKNASDGARMESVRPRRGRGAVMAFLVFFLSAVMASAQAPAMSDTTKIALDKVREEFQDINQKTLAARQHLNSIEQDIAKEHPGFHLDEQTLTIVADAKPVKPDAPKPPATK